MIALRIRFIAVLCLFAMPLTAAAIDLPFEQGSLIIPEQMAYQNNCGTVASYGLVYRLLQRKIPVYWAVKPTKTSHHRCKNSVTDTEKDAKFIDGCDFAVEKDSGNPVSLVNIRKGTFDEFTTFDTTGNPNNTGEVALKVDNKVKRVRYMGGPFIVAATDAPTVLTLLKSDSDFVKYNGVNTMPTTCNPGSAFYVRVHRANNAFVAPIARVMNEPPPPIALVEGRNTSNAGSVEILRTYLANAGLDFAGAEGTFENHGKIFDVLNQDRDIAASNGYAQGKLNYTPDAAQPNKTYYKVMWSPHWDGDTTSASQQANLKSALANIASFVDRGNSIFNECASIETYEGSYKPTDAQRRPYLDNGTPKKPLNIPTQFMTGVEQGNADDQAQKQEETGLQTLDQLELLGTLGAFPAKSQDCSDPNRAGDCLVFTNYGDLFSQRGDYALSVERSVVEAFRPRKGQRYNKGVVQMISTKSSDTSKDGWDLYVSRLKDNDPLKGNVIYLAGHSFAYQAGGNRIVLNTLLNLAFKATSLETSRSEPVADLTYKPDGSLDAMRVLSGTFLDTPTNALFPERVNFRTEKAGDWVFPYIEGRVRSYVSKNIDDERQSFGLNAEWEASERMPTPGARNIFTVLGTNQAGLQRIKFERTQLEKSSSCVDTKATGKINKVCDLQEAMGWDRDSSGNIKLGPDATGEIPSTVSESDIKAINHMSQHFLQRVRGFCVAHGGSADVWEPTEGQCDNQKFGTVRSVLGGVDHASPAVVGRSKYINTPRAEVAYVGGRDGQLHALYLRGTQPGFTPPATGAGTELWAFVPKGQLPRMMTNDARVDISPAISDVFADYEDKNDDGVLSPTERSTKNFSWHTVLVSGSGRLGGELFALDVTNPLKPIVLWDVVSTIDKTDSEQQAENTVAEWRESWKDGDNAPPPTYDNLSTPSRLSGPYNYADLGDTLGVNLVPVRRGNRPSYQVVVASNGGVGGVQQLQVFALDAGTGKKLWQWTRPYTNASNSVPGGASTLDVDGDGSMDRVYVGDMEGRVWELSAHSGINLNYFTKAGGGAVSYPLFATESRLHPVTTAPAIMRLPPVIKQETLLSNMGATAKAAGKLALVFGTAGVDWVLSDSPNIKGRVYVLAALPEDKDIRDQLSYDKTNEVPVEVRGPMAIRGTLKPVAAAYMSLDAGERAMGTPKVVGSKMVLSTSYGTTETSPLSSDMRGLTHLVDMNETTPDTKIGDSGKSAASVLVLPNGDIISQSMVGLQRTKVDPPPKAGLAGKRTPVRIGSWLDLGRALTE